MISQNLVQNWLHLSKFTYPSCLFLAPKSKENSSPISPKVFEHHPHHPISWDESNLCNSTWHAFTVCRMATCEKSMRWEIASWVVSNWRCIFSSIICSLVMTASYRGKCRWIGNLRRKSQSSKYEPQIFCVSHRLWSPDLVISVFCCQDYFSVLALPKAKDKHHKNWKAVHFCKLYPQLWHTPIKLPGMASMPVEPSPLLPNMKGPDKTGETNEWVHFTPSHTKLIFHSSQRHIGHPEHQKNKQKTNTAAFGGVYLLNTMVFTRKKHLCQEALPVVEFACHPCHSWSLAKKKLLVFQPDPTKVLFRSSRASWLVAQAEPTCVSTSQVCLNGISNQVESKPQNKARLSFPATFPATHFGHLCHSYADGWPDDVFCRRKTDKNLVTPVSPTTKHVHVNATS